MPLHDWSDERGWDSVHPVWLTYVLEHVQERLPAGYKAYLGGVPALMVGGATGRPDLSVREWLEPSVELLAGGDADALQPDFETSVAVQLDPEKALHIERHGRLVAAMELVSPRNKDRAEAKETYANRYMGYLLLGVHLLLIDVLPRPKGFSFADVLAGKLGLSLPPLPPPFAVSYRVGGPAPVGNHLGQFLAVWRRPLHPARRCRACPCHSMPVSPSWLIWKRHTTAPPSGRTWSDGAMTVGPRRA